MPQKPTTPRRTNTPPSQLSRLIKSKYPGEYDDWDDFDLEVAMMKKYPGEYDDLASKAARIETKSPVHSSEGTFGEIGSYLPDFQPKSHGKVIDTAWNAVFGGKDAKTGVHGALNRIGAAANAESDEYGFGGLAGTIDPSSVGSTIASVPKAMGSYFDLGGFAEGTGKQAWNYGKELQEANTGDPFTQPLRRARAHTKATVGLFGGDYDSMEQSALNKDWGGLAADVALPVGMGALMYGAGKVEPVAGVPKTPKVKVVPGVPQLTEVAGMPNWVKRADGYVDPTPAGPLPTESTSTFFNRSKVSESARTNPQLFMDEMVQRAQEALDKGETVHLVTDNGKRTVPITRISNGGLYDPQGQRWGVGAMYNSELEGLRFSSGGAAAPTASAPFAAGRPGGPTLDPTAPPVVEPVAEPFAEKVFTSSPIRKPASGIVDTVPEDAVPVGSGSTIPRTGLWEKLKNRMGDLYSDESGSASVDLLTGGPLRDAFLEHIKKNGLEDTPEVLAAFLKARGLSYNETMASEAAKAKLERAKAIVREKEANPLQQKVDEFNQRQVDPISEVEKKGVAKFERPEPKTYTSNAPSDPRSLPPVDAPKFEPGDLVRHKEHGVGRIALAPGQLQKMSVQEMDIYSDRIRRKPHPTNPEGDVKALKEVDDEFARRRNLPKLVKSKEVDLPKGVEIPDYVVKSLDDGTPREVLNGWLGRISSHLIKGEELSPENVAQMVRETGIQEEDVYHAHEYMANRLANMDKEGVDTTVVPEGAVKNLPPVSPVVKEEIKQPTLKTSTVEQMNELYRYLAEASDRAKDEGRLREHHEFEGGIAQLESEYLKRNEDIPARGTHYAKSKEPERFDVADKDNLTLEAQLDLEDIEKADHEELIKLHDMWAKEESQLLDKGDKRSARYSTKMRLAAADKLIQSGKSVPGVPDAIIKLANMDYDKIKNAKTVEEVHKLLERYGGDSLDFLRSGDKDFHEYFDGLEEKALQKLAELTYPKLSPKEARKALEAEADRDVDTSVVPEGAVRKLPNLTEDIVDGVHPDASVPIKHDPRFGGFQTHARGGKYYVTTPLEDKPAGPFDTQDDAQDWVLDYQESEKFLDHLEEQHKDLPEKEKPRVIRERKPENRVYANIESMDDNTFFGDAKPEKKVDRHATSYDDMNDFYNTLDELARKRLDGSIAKKEGEVRSTSPADPRSLRPYGSYGIKDRLKELRNSIENNEDVDEAVYNLREEILTEKDPSTIARNAAQAEDAFASTSKGSPLYEAMDMIHDAAQYRYDKMKDEGGKPFKRSSPNAVDLDEYFPKEMRVKGVKEGNAGDNVAIGGGDPRLLSVLGGSLYSKQVTHVVMKELLQNSFDEHREHGTIIPIKVMLREHQKYPGSIVDGNALTVRDNGEGLSPEEMYTVLTNVGETGKAGVVSASGGFGLAKAAPFLSAKYVKVSSIVKEPGMFGKMKKVKYTFEGNPDQLKVQTKGVPLNKETVKDNVPTGLETTVYFDSNANGWYNVGGFAEKMAKGSPSSPSGIELLTGTYMTEKKLRQWLDEDPANPIQVDLSNKNYSNPKDMAHVYQPKPMPTYQETIQAPGAEIKIHYDTNPTDEFAKADIHYLNKGMYQASTYISYGDKTKNVPGSIMADIIANVEEDHPDYPFSANRENIKYDVTEAINEWVNDNIVTGVMKKRIAELQKMYDSITVLHPDGATEMHYLDTGSKFRPEEIDFIASHDEFTTALMAIEAVANKMIRVMDSLGWSPENYGATWTRPSERLKKFGLLFQEPDPSGVVLGIHIPRPDDLNNSAIMINLLESIKLADKEDSPLDHLITSLFTTLAHEFGHVPGGSHDKSFAYRDAQLRAKFGEFNTTSLFAQLRRAFDDGHGEINPKLREVLSVYEKSRGRSASGDDALLASGIDIKRPADRPGGEESNEEGSDSGETESESTEAQQKIAVTNPSEEQTKHLESMGYVATDVKNGQTIFTKAAKSKTEGKNTGKKPIPSVQAIIDKKKKKNPVMNTGFFVGAGESLPERFRNSKLYEAIYEPIGVSNLTALQRLGEAGERLAKLLKDERTESARLGGEHALTVRKAMRSLNETEQFEVAMVLDGQVPANRIKSAKVFTAYKEIREALNQLADLAVAAGVTMKNAKGETVPFQRLKGEFLPHRYPEELFKDPTSLRERLLKHGKDKDGNRLSGQVVDAIIDNVVKKGERFSPSQHTRDFNMPGYRTDLGVVAQYMYEMSRAITRAKRFGPADMADANSPIMQLVRKAKNSSKAEKIVNDYLGRVEHEDLSSAHDVYDVIVQIEVATKLSQFGLTNMGDLASMSSALGTGNVSKALADIFADPHGTTDIAVRTGAHSILKNELYADVGKGNILGKAYGTITSEKALRGIAAIAGRARVKQLFEMAKKDPRYKTQFGRFVDGNVDHVLQQSELTDRQIDFGGARGVELSSGIPDKLTLPKVFLSKNPIPRLIFLFKRFGFVNLKNMADTIHAEPTGLLKAKKAALIVGSYLVMGEVIGDIKALIEGLASGELWEAISGRGAYIDSKNWPLKIGDVVGGKVLDRIIANAMQSALFGLVGDLTESFVQRNMGKVSGTLGGPVIGDLDELASAGASALGKNHDFRPLGKSVVRRIPYVGKGLATRWQRETDKQKKAERNKLDYGYDPEKEKKKNKFEFRY